MLGAMFDKISHHRCDTHLQQTGNYNDCPGFSQLYQHYADKEFKLLY